MKRYPMKKVPATSLIVDRSVNYRDDYDTVSMAEQIRSAGKVLEPIHVIKETGVVLKGNRRVLTVQELLLDPKLPSDLKSAIEDLDVIFYEGLTDDEITELVLDHGSQKPLSRVETIKAVWRLVKQMKSEKDIICLMYHLLARFTGQTRKAAEAQQLPAGAQREEFLKKWLHGTVGNYLTAAHAMGALVQEQLLLSELALDRALTDEEKAKVQFKVSRDRVTKLSKAKNADKDKEGWDPEKGGAEFNALIQSFRDEDAGRESSSTVKRPTPKQMSDAADGMKSVARVFYQHCAGTLSDADKKRIEEVDTEIHRATKVKDAIVVHLDAVRAKNALVAELLSTIAYKGEAEVIVAIQSFIAS